MKCIHTLRDKVATVCKLKARVFLFLIQLYVVLDKRATDRLFETRIAINLLPGHSTSQHACVIALRNIHSVPKPIIIY